MVTSTSRRASWSPWNRADPSPGRSSPVADGELGQVYFPSARQVHVFDLETGEHVESINTLLPMFSSLEIVEARRWLLVSGNSEAIDVRDLDDDRWVARLSAPEEIVGLTSSGSTDGRYVATVGILRNTSRPPGQDLDYRLLIHDLTPLIDAEVKRARSGASEPPG